MGVFIIKTTRFTLGLFFFALILAFLTQIMPQVGLAKSFGNENLERAQSYQQTYRRLFGEPALAGEEAHKGLIDYLVPISKEVFDQLNAIDPLLLRAGVERKNILRVDIAFARLALETMISGHWGSMEFMANPFFQRDPRVLYFPKETLTVMNKEYYVITPFFTHGRTHSDFKSERMEVPKRSYFEHEVLLIGAGQIAVVYPFHVLVNRKDPQFGILTGNYELHRVNWVDIASTPQQYVLMNFRGRDFPDIPLEPLLGPLNVQMKEIWQKNGTSKDKRAFLKTTLSRWNMDQPLFSKYNPPLYNRHLGLGDIPADVRSEAVSLAGGIR